VRVRKSHIDRRYVFSSKIETFPSPGYNEVNSYIEVRASVMCERKLSERCLNAVHLACLLSTRPQPPSPPPSLPPSYQQSQQRRIQELERINIDLERRLEQQARERMKLERESAENKRAWEAQHADIGRVSFWGVVGGEEGG
jgi:hypothetical protein